MAKVRVPAGSSLDRTLRWGLVAAALGVAVAIPFLMVPVWVNRFTLVVVFAIATLGLNLLTGYNGQISLGHSFFFAIGAYTAAILVEDHAWHFLWTLPPAFALTFVLGFLLGIPALRLEGLYLALVTLALAVVTPPFIKRFDDLTGGSQGIVVSKPDAPGWSGLADDQWRYLVCLAVAVVLFVVAWNLVRGRVGRALVAIRDNHIAAETMGVNLSVFKSITFAYSAAYAGVAGALYAVVIGFVSPEQFTVTMAIRFLTGAVVGGLATIAGPVFGAAFTQLLPEWAFRINDAAPNVIYGVVLILVMIFMPSGIVGLLTRLRDKVIDRAPVDAGHEPSGSSGPSADGRPPSPDAEPAMSHPTT